MVRSIIIVISLLSFTDFAISCEGEQIKEYYQKCGKRKCKSGTVGVKWEIVGIIYEDGIKKYIPFNQSFGIPANVMKLSNDVDCKKLTITNSY